MNNKISRNRSRRILFQLLYANTFQNNDIDLFNDSFVEERYEDKLDELYIKEMQEVIKINEPIMLWLIHKYAPKFKVEEMRTEYIIPIFIALWEMLYLNEEIPSKVSINEAIELCKKYSDDSARKIVNWILNKVLEDIHVIKNNTESYTYWNHTIFSK